jgi:hypothetical protein
MQNGGRAGAAVLLPAGRYRVTQYIELQQSNVAVRGEGVSGRAGRRCCCCSWAAPASSWSWMVRLFPWPLCQQELAPQSGWGTGP